MKGTSGKTKLAPRTNSYGENNKDKVTIKR